MTEDEMIGWHHGLDGHGFEWTPGVGDGQGGLMCCGLWGRKESDTTETELTMVAEFFPGMPSRISGIGLAGLEKKAVEVHRKA